MANITIRIDETLKKELQQLVSELGMDVTTFFTMAAKQAVRMQALPFTPETNIEPANKKGIKVYSMINKRERDPDSELTLYTIDELKNYFEPCKDLKEEYPEEWAELWKLWQNIKDIDDLKNYLEVEYAGDEVPYEFEEDVVDDIGQLKRFNRYFRRSY